MRAELSRERAHRIILRTGGDAQAAIAFPARFPDQTLEQQAADAAPPHAVLDAEGDLGKLAVRLRRMQLRRAAHQAVFHIGNDDGAVGGTSGSITLDETVIQDAVETIVTAF